MSVKKTIDIEVTLENGDKVIKQFEDLGNGVLKLADSNEKLDASFDDVYNGMAPLTTRMGEAEDRLYELSLAGDTTSKEFQELLTKVGQYRKVQIETDLAVDSAATTMGQKLGGALGGATSGFAAVQGAMGLVGSESEQLEKTLLKVQSALAIQQGVQGIREAIPTFKQLGATASLAFKNMTTASKAFAVTGIGLLLTAVALAISKMDELKAMFDDTSVSQKALNDTTEAMANAQKNATIEVEKVRAAFDLAKEGVISKDEALGQYNETLGGALGTAKTLNEAEEIFNKKTGAYIKAVALRAQANALFEKAAQLQADAIIEAMEVEDKQINQYLGLGGLTGSAISFADDMFGVLDDANNEIAESQRKNIKATADASAATLNNLAKDLLKQLNETTTEYDINLNKTSTSTITNAKTTAKELEDIQNEILRKRFEAIEDPHRRAKLLRRLDLKEELEALKQRNISQEQFNEMSKFIQTEFREDMMAINAFYADEEIVAMQVQAATEIKITEEKNTQLKRLSKELSDEEKANNLAVQQSKIKFANDAFSALSDLTNAFAGESEKSQKKAFEINKAIGIAQAVINTAGAISAAINPAVGGLGIPAGLPGAVLAAATGAAQIATIAKTEFQGGGGGETPSVDASGGGAAQAPSFNVVGDSGINQLAQLQQAPVQAFVVSGEVTTSQALDRNRVENATL